MTIATIMATNASHLACVFMDQTILKIIYIMLMIDDNNEIRGTFEKHTICYDLNPML